MSRDGRVTEMLAVDDGVARLDLTGTVDMDWCRRLRGAVSALRSHPDVRVVLLCSRGPVFSLGGDLRWMQRQADPAVAIEAIARLAHEAMLELDGLDAPTVARVHGAAAGIGVSLVLAADIAIAARSASFTLGYTAVGFSPDGGATWRLPRLVGWRRASELILTNRIVDADEAARIGLVTTCVEDVDLDAHVEDMLRRIGSGPTLAYGISRRLLADAATRTLDEHLDDEATSIAQLVASPTGQEGIDAFLTRRPPRFPA